eukprot:759911-Hanusia_phi.AAC.3
MVDSIRSAPWQMPEMPCPKKSHTVNAEICDHGDFIEQIQSLMFQEECQVAVSLESPLKIVLANEEWLKTFGYSQSTIKNRTLRIMQGPYTHTANLHQLLFKATTEKSAEAHLTLYSSNGTPMIMRTIAHVHEVGSKQICILQMFNSEAVSISEAMKDENVAKGLMCTSRPRRFTFASLQFSKLFGFTEQQSQNCAPRMIEGPQTDVCTFQSMFANCTKGIVQDGYITFYSSKCEPIACTLTMIPISDCGGNISHILVKYYPDALRFSSSGGQQIASSTDMYMAPPVKFPVRRNKHWSLAVRANERARTNRAIGLELQAEVEEMKKMNESGPYQQPQAPSRPPRAFHAESVATTEAETEMEDNDFTEKYDTISQTLSKSPRPRSSLDTALCQNISYLWSVVMVFYCYFAALPLAVKKAYTNSNASHKLKARDCMVSSDFSRSFKLSRKERRIMDSWIQLD